MGETYETGETYEKEQDVPYVLISVVTTVFLNRDDTIFFLSEKTNHFSGIPLCIKGRSRLEKSGLSRYYGDF
jgi:hypothetical protein